MQYINLDPQENVTLANLAKQNTVHTVGYSAQKSDRPLIHHPYVYVTHCITAILCIQLPRWHPLKETWENIQLRSVHVRYSSVYN